jgi:hypothetical protein
MPWPSLSRALALLFRARVRAIVVRVTIHVRTVFDADLVSVLSTLLVSVLSTLLVSVLSTLLVSLPSSQLVSISSIGIQRRAIGILPHERMQRWRRVSIPQTPAELLQIPFVANELLGSLAAQ